MVLRFGECSWCPRRESSAYTGADKKVDGKPNLTTGQLIGREWSSHELQSMSWVVAPYQGGHRILYRDYVPNPAEVSPYKGSMSWGLTRKNDGSSHGYTVEFKKEYDCPPT